MDMKKRIGFTLIELLAVLVVLAIILAIAVPTIGNVIKNSTRNAFEIDAKMVLKAVDYKRVENKKFDPLIVTKENMNDQIGIDSSQYAQVTFKPTEETIEMILVGAGKWDGLIAYGTIDNMHVVNSEDYDDTPPSITIIGDNPIEIGKGSTYTDAGATAFDLKDGDVPLTWTVIKNVNGTVVDSVDTSTFTTYTITYTAVDSQGNIGSAARQVVVKDKTAPVITILGSNPASINVGGTYSDAGATALDETDGNVTSKIVATGTETQVL
jgi:prepilin-type N-terminal cleavage/methylation domain-containing protein